MRPRGIEVLARGVLRGVSRYRRTQVAPTCCSIRGDRRCDRPVSWVYAILMLDGRLEVTSLCNGCRARVEKALDLSQADAGTKPPKWTGLCPPIPPQPSSSSDDESVPPPGWTYAKIRKWIDADETVLVEDPEHAEPLGVRLRWETCHDLLGKCPLAPSTINLTIAEAWEVHRFERGEPT